MDPTIIVGLLAGIALLYSAIGIEYLVALFVDVNSLLIVIGGTISVTVMHFPLTQTKMVFSRLKIAFSMKRKNFVNVMDEMIDIAVKFKREGRVGMGKEIDNIKDFFLKDAVQLLIDNVTREEMEDILNSNLSYIKMRHRLGRKYFEEMAIYAPAFGLIGTLIGLIIMLANLDDPSSLGPAMSIALITTFYGSLFSNLIFAPLAGRLTIVNDEELVQKQMIKEALLCMLDGQSTYVIREKMGMLLTSKQRMDLAKKKKEK